MRVPPKDKRPTVTETPKAAPMPMETAPKVEAPRPPVRIDFELTVVWRSVEAAERARTSGVAAAPSVSDDLRNFLRFGSSSLTPYEADTIAAGIADARRPGIETPVTQYVTGDRVELTLPDRAGAHTTRGIVVARGQSVLAVDRENAIRAWPIATRAVETGTARITKVLAGALVDRRPGGSPG